MSLLFYSECRKLEWLRNSHGDGCRSVVCTFEVCHRLSEIHGKPFCKAWTRLLNVASLVDGPNLFWSLNWCAEPEYLTAAKRLDRTDLVIGCVETRAARSLIATSVTGRQSNVDYWLDIGNNASSGQIVLGEPWNWVNKRSATRLRTVAELFPEIIDASLDDDEEPSCSAVEALDRQEPFVNQTLAYHALALLARLFRYGEVAHHGAFVNLATGRAAPLPVEPKDWKRMRKRTGRVTPSGARNSR